MGKYLILSDLKVHHEQIGQNVGFFSPDNVAELASIISILINTEIKPVPQHYDGNLVCFADKFMQAINEN